MAQVVEGTLRKKRSISKIIEIVHLILLKINIYEILKKKFNISLRFCFIFVIGWKFVLYWAAIQYQMLR